MIDSKENGYHSIKITKEPKAIMSKDELTAKVNSYPHWYHRIYLGQGIYTHNRTPTHEGIWKLLRELFPIDLKGSSVLDIGCNAGFFSIQMKLLKAGRVLGIDSKENFIQRIPEKKGISQKLPDYYYLEQAEFCRQIWNLDIEYMALDATHINMLNETFDIVLFMGILYHLRNPFRVLEDIGKLTKDVIVVETEVISPNDKNQVFVHHGPTGKIKKTKTTQGIMKFVEGDELNSDDTNWWIPDTECVKGMLRVSGFKYFSEPIHFKGRRLLLLASKQEKSILKIH